MSIKVPYTYIDYRGYPELTEISERRARLSARLGMCLFPAFMLSVVALCSSEGKVGGIIGIALTVLLTIWLFTGYKKRTERMIKKAYARYVQNEKKKKHSDWRHTWDADSEDDDVE